MTGFRVKMCLHRLARICGGVPLFVVVCLVAPVMIAACGESVSVGQVSGAREGRASNVAGGVRAVPGRNKGSNIWVLVKKRIPGGYLSIEASRHTYGRQSVARLGVVIKRSDDQVIPSGYGMPLGPGFGGVLELVVYHACVLRHSYTVVYGLLRAPRDIVVAVEAGESLTLKKVELPGGLHHYGVLVYAMIGRGPTNIVTRTSSGQIVRSATYARRASGVAVCHRS